MNIMNKYIHVDRYITYFKILNVDKCSKCESGVLIISNERDISPPPSLVTGEGDGLSSVYPSQSSGLT